MADRSIFARGGSGNTRGGLDRFLGPTGIDESSLPPSIEDPAHVPEPEHPVDCAGAGKDEPVCQIAQAEKDLGRTDG